MPGAVEINLPMLIGRRNVTEWRTENFFLIDLLTLKKLKAQHSRERCARVEIAEIVAGM